jgi:hypothetical protein
MFSFHRAGWRRCGRTGAVRSAVARARPLCAGALAAASARSARGRTRAARSARPPGSARTTTASGRPQAGDTSPSPTMGRAGTARSAAPTSTRRTGSARASGFARCTRRGRRSARRRALPHGVRGATRSGGAPRSKMRASGREEGTGRERPVPGSYDFSRIVVISAAALTSTASTRIDLASMSLPFDENRPGTLIGRTAEVVSTCRMRTRGSRLRCRPRRPFGCRRTAFVVPADHRRAVSDRVYFSARPWREAPEIPRESLGWLKPRGEARA